jgi:hypothetical protein
MISKLTFVTLTLFTLSAGNYAQGSNPKKERLATTSPLEQITEKKTISIQDKAHVEGGFINVLKVKDSYYLAIPDSILGRDLLFAGRVEKISNNKQISAGQIRKDPILVRFQKKGNRIVIEYPQDYRIVDEKDPIAKAIDKNNITPEFQLFDIEETTGGNSYIIDVTKFFADEIAYVSPLDGKIKSGRLETKAVQVIRMIVNHQTLEVSTVLPFVSDRDASKVILRYSLYLLPKVPMMARVNDDRIGFFSKSKRIYESGQPVSTQQFIARWCIEPKPEDIDKFKKGELVIPAKPIVFYIDPVMPVQWRSYVKQGIEDWNKAFEKIGFKNVIEAKDYPQNDVSFDEFSFRYNCFRYLPVEDANASGEMYYDPRTGEIVRGDIFWYHNVIKLLQEWRYVQTAAADPKARTLTLDNATMGELIRYAVAHEMGHVLGLQHNMRASYAFPVDSLRSATFTQRYGTTASIMDYARNNYVAQPEDKDVKFTPPILGDFDYFSIKYGYKPILSATSTSEEVTTLEQWFKDNGSDPKYLYSGTAVARVMPDPSSQADALGDDAVKASTYGIKNLKVIVKNTAKWLYNKTETPEIYESTYAAIFKQYSKELGHTLSYIGGVYEFSGTIGNLQAKQKVVDAEKQRQALAFAVNEIRNIGWLNEKSLIPYIGSKVDMLFQKQNDVVDDLLGNFIPSRIIANEGLGCTYTIEHYLNDLSNCVLKAGAVNDRYVQNLQICYVQKLKALSENKEQKGTILSAATYAQINGLKEMLMLKAEKSTNGMEKRYIAYLLQILKS